MLKKKLLENFSSEIRGFLRKSQIDTDNKFLLELNSDGVLSLCGVEDLREYNGCSILAVTRAQVIRIEGRGLFIDTFGDRLICIRGEINSIEFLHR